MGELDDLSETIEAIHSAGLGESGWVSALARVASFAEGAAITIEHFDKKTLGLRESHQHAVPEAGQLRYVEQYVKINSRMPKAILQPRGKIIWDYQFTDEDTIRHDPFYQEFLGSLDLRYFVGGIVVSDHRDFVCYGIHRSPKQGHVDAKGIARCGLLLPHFRDAVDVAQRLKGAQAARRSLEGALARLADGVALLHADGTLAYSNEALHVMARNGDGFRIGGSRLQWIAPEARRRFAVALDALIRTRRGADFPAARSGDAPPYLASLRPLVGTFSFHGGAVAMLFIRDPLSRHEVNTEILNEIYGFTPAEAHLAIALRSGMAIRSYAAASKLSINTVYTHLRRVKEKTRTQRLSDLVRKLGEIRTALR